MFQHTTWIIDRSTLFREGLKLILSDTPFHVTWEVARMSLVYDDANRLSELPSIVIIALHSSLDPGSEDAMQLTRICQLLPDASIVVLSDAASLAQCVAAMRAGVKAFLLCDITPEVLRQSLNLALTGEKILSTDLVNLIVDGGQQLFGRGEIKYQEEFSTREKMMLQCLANGYSNKLIGTQLGIIEATVKVHIKTLFRKMRIRNRTEAAIWALRNGYEPGNARLSRRTDRRERDIQLHPEV